MLWEALKEAFSDTAELAPFLFLTYLVMEFLEQAAGERAKKAVLNAGRKGPVIGGLLGIVPQCGFSAAASYFYIERMISLGTLLAVYLSTSDEMLPILISEKVPGGTIVKILAVKALIGIVTGVLTELFIRRHPRRTQDVEPSDVIPDDGSCGCAPHLVAAAVVKTLQVLLFIFLVTLCIDVLVEAVGMDRLQGLFRSIPVLSEFLAALIGLIPNCASSVVITQLYLDDVISAGAMMAGLLASAGLGLLVLFRERRSVRKNVEIVALLYAVSVAWGIVIRMLGIAF